MHEELTEVIRFLSESGYIIRTPQSYYVFTNKFYQDFTRTNIGIVPDSTAVIAKSSQVHVVVPLPSYTTESYKQFIIDARVPRHVVNPRGERYDTNQYSQKAAKAFVKMMASGNIDYELLVRSTELYYKSSGGYKLKIGNYIADGAWQTHYETLKEALARASDQPVTDYIKQELSDDNRSRYQLEQRTGEEVSRGLSEKSSGWPKGQELRSKDIP